MCSLNPKVKLALDRKFLVQVEKNGVNLIDTRRTRLLVRLSGNPRSVHYTKFRSLAQHAAVYAELRAGKIQPPEFQRAWSTILHGRTLLLHTPAAMIAALMDWLTDETTPTSPVSTEAQIRERMGAYAPKLDS